MAEIRIAIIGFGKIARDQHLPAIIANPAFRLVAIASTSAVADAGVPGFSDHRAMLAAVDVDAVAICTPPGPRHAIARDCLEQGLDVLLEKPPGASLGEVADLAALAERNSRCLFTTWHARFNEPVARAAELIRQEGLRSLSIRWLEDVEKWHPGQAWIWAPGGFGVFDAGINALSIATALCPERLLLKRADFVMHGDGQQPIAATLALASAGVAGEIEATFDWRHKGQEQWTIEADTAAGRRLSLSEGGALLETADMEAVRSSGQEYPAIYTRFASLIEERASLIDAEPLRVVADAFLLARRLT